MRRRGGGSHEPKSPALAPNTAEGRPPGPLESSAQPLPGGAESAGFGLVVVS